MDILKEKSKKCAYITNIFTVEMVFNVISLATTLYTIIFIIKAGNLRTNLTWSDLLTVWKRLRIPEKIYKKRGSYLDKNIKDIEMDGRTKIPQAGAPLDSGGFKGSFGGKHFSIHTVSHTLSTLFQIAKTITQIPAAGEEQNNHLYLKTSDRWTRMTIRPKMPRLTDNTLIATDKPIEIKTS